ncbi:MAG: alpha-amylase family glycosyl hydrolase [Thiohalomonadales bacterium]
MPMSMVIHFDNALAIDNPYLWIWYEGSAINEDVAPITSDDFGLVFQVEVRQSRFRFKFKQGSGSAGPWEHDSLNRRYRPQKLSNNTLFPSEIWCKGDKAFVYHQQPRKPEAQTAAEFLNQLDFKSATYIPDTGGLTGLGATVLTDNRVLFGFYHPNAARVFLMGSFNNWQRPGGDNQNQTEFIEMNLYQGYFGLPNIWLAVTDKAAPGDEYKFCIFGGVPRDHKNRTQRYQIDPYARLLNNDFSSNNAVICDPSDFTWSDREWKTPVPGELILYELSVHGFTDGDPDISDLHHGKFAGISDRITNGYFDKLGVTALSLMPLSEFPSIQGPSTLGYNPSLFCTVERDFGTPDDLRQLVNTAHQHSMAVILDQVFNHTDNSFNPLWQAILEHPDEELRADEGGLYFNGSTPWGNRVATEKQDVQNMLIDACKLFMVEYHVDGFRFDATHQYYMNHEFLQRLATELQGFKSDVILIAENLPNQRDLNRNGFDGYAQWCDQFHDKSKALLREGSFENQWQYNTDHIGDMFYFSKGSFASHTNNVVNYCESHDENSVAFEVASNPTLNNPAAKDRKGRLGMMSTMVAMGEPMIYMGQEFNIDRPRNIVTVDWPKNLDETDFYQWSSRLINLRKRYPALKLSGYNPETTGQFQWTLAPWMDKTHGGGSKVVGWRAKPNGDAHDTMLVMLNFENYDVQVDLDFGIPGKWVKLADSENVNDIAPMGTNSEQDTNTISTLDGNFRGFNLPSSSGFIYKWQAPIS